VNQQALTPMMTSITLSVVVGICARHHHVASDSEDTFSVSPALAYLMFAIGLLFLRGSVPDWDIRQHSTDSVLLDFHAVLGRCVSCGKLARSYRRRSAG